jgi:hypothetical protein
MAAKKNTGSVVIPPNDAGAVAEMQELVADHAELRAGKMFGCPAYFLGTKAVVAVFGTDLCITLPQTRVTELLKLPGCRPFVAARGRAMNGWLLVAPDRLRTLNEEQGVLDQAIAYARAKSLIPAVMKKGPTARIKPSPLFSKLNLKAQDPIVVVNAPDDVRAELKGVRVHDALTAVKSVSFFLGFVTRQKEVDTLARAVANKADGDAVVWFAYPKSTSKRYKCEFNRDTGWAALGEAGFEGVRQVAIDQDWSALRFRRVEYVKSMKRDPKRALSQQGKARTKR